MKYLLTIAMLVLFADAAGAHSVENLNKRLSEKEQYFQALDEEAPGFALRDADGKTVRLRDFRGKALVLNFIYMNCPDVCPLHAERIAKIQKMIGAMPMRNMVQFVTITTDPENDTPDVMRGYGETHGLDDANWVFLTSGTGGLRETRELVENYGHKFTKIDDGIQVHGVVTHVIDRDGRLRANFH